jgi:hypothetical protein
MSVSAHDANRDGVTRDSEFGVLVEAAIRQANELLTSVEEHGSPLTSLARAPQGKDC